MTQEALKLALEALETELSIDWTNNDEFNASAEKMHEAIVAIKEALAHPEQEPTNIERHEANIQKFLGAPQQPEQKPVAVVDVHEFYDNCANFSLLQKLPKGKHTLYTTPPQRTFVGLTDEEIYEIGFDLNIGGIQTMKAYKAIEAKLRSKNT